MNKMKYLNFISNSKSFLSKSSNLVNFANLAPYVFAVLAAITTFQLQGCAAVAVSTAGAGVVMVKDRRTVGTIVDDQTIELKATQAFSKNPAIWKQSHINAFSYNNSILLVGQAPSEDVKLQAENLVKDIPKVQRVYNEIMIGAPVSLTTRSKDSWITTQIKTKLIGNKEISSARVKVVTENGVVYLMGLTTHQEKLIVTEIARAVPGVEKVIQIFEDH